MITVTLRAPFDLNLDPKDPKRSQDAHKQTIHRKQLRKFTMITKGR